MAVKLVKTVKREMVSTRRGLSIIVSLEPGDEISFRLKKRKKSFSVSLHHCFSLAMIMTIENEYQAKLEKYQRDKKIGLRRKRPVKSTNIFNPMYHKALNQANYADNH